MERGRCMLIQRRTQLDVAESMAYTKDAAGCRYTTHVWPRSTAYIQVLIVRREDNRRTQGKPLKHYNNSTHTSSKFENQDGALIPSDHS